MLRHGEVKVADAFLRPSEISGLLNFATTHSKQLRRSWLTDDKGGRVLSTNRTSTSVCVPCSVKAAKQVLKRLETHVLRPLCGLVLSDVTVEPLQVVRYAPSQRFGLHHDAGTLIESPDHPISAWPVEPVYGDAPGYRFLSVFVYLAAPTVGGRTHFPCLGTRVRPVNGRAAIWLNHEDDAAMVPDPRMVHAGEAVKRGVKFGLNIWVSRAASSR